MGFSFNEGFDFKWYGNICVSFSTEIPNIKNWWYVGIQFPLTNITFRIHKYAMQLQVLDCSNHLWWWFGCKCMGRTRRMLIDEKWGDGYVSCSPHGRG